MSCPARSDSKHPPIEDAAAGSSCAQSPLSFLRSDFDIFCDVKHRHTSRFLVIYVTFMPFTLWSACGWGAVPASVIIAFLLLGIEEIGVQIEEPFGILPLGEAGLGLGLGVLSLPNAQSLFC